MKDEIMDGAAGDRLTRRDLLKIAGAGGLATAFGAGTGRTSQARLAIPRQHPPDNARYDVVVVGGGVSGAYVAWRLLEDDPSRRVALCELSERIGGRLLSITPPGAPHLRAELGGMRLLNTQEQVARLIEHLGLTVDRFQMGDTRDLVYLRGRRWTQADWQDRHAVPYVLTADAGTAANRRTGQEPGRTATDRSRVARPGCRPLWANRLAAFQRDGNRRGRGDRTTTARCRILESRARDALLRGVSARPGWWRILQRSRELERC